ncbi:unnamed protein product [Anisakis simplex]|uniref:Protein sprouty (inferred by orthology to a D. melanogaster protein) n=1 Tax=Anisakis simplex TaxID=6269 RepID=A0A0M3K4B8_ANISI|nr:unnamed protein product [Anisakis simplex]
MPSYSNHLSTTRLTKSEKNVYTPAPDAAQSMSGIEQPSTSSSYQASDHELKPKQRSTSDLSINVKRRIIAVNSSRQTEPSDEISPVDTVPVVLSSLSCKLKRNLNPHYDTHGVQETNRFFEMFALCCKMMPHARSIDFQPFQNTLHVSFGDADKYRLAKRSECIDGSSSSSLVRLRVCPKCHRCRCVQCSRRRHLPSKWICGDTCLLSSSCLVDTLSCMCCVKATRYHCHCLHQSSQSDAHSNSSISGLKIALGRRRIVELVCVVLALPCLPCLCCYLPLKGCEAAADAIYCSWNDNSCHCDRRVQSSVTVITEQPQTISAKL